MTLTSSMLRFLETKQMRMCDSAQMQAKLHELRSILLTMLARYSDALDSLAMPAKYSDVKLDDGLATLRKRTFVLLASLLEILRIRLI